jgi:hypothetical protein
MEGMDCCWADNEMKGWLAEHHFASIYSPRKCCNIYLYVNLALIFVPQAAGSTDTPTSGPLRHGSILTRGLQKEDLLLLAPLDWIHLVKFI